MGITIDKAIDIMEYYKEYGAISQRNGRNKAVEVMRKYQKIEEIISNENYLYEYNKMKDIKKVIGNETGAI